MVDNTGFRKAMATKLLIVLAALSVLLVCTAEICKFNEALENHVNKVLGFKKPQIAVVRDCQMAKKVNKVNMHFKYPNVDSASDFFVSVRKLKVKDKSLFAFQLAFDIYGSLTKAVEAFDRDPLNKERKGKVFIGCDYKKLKKHLVLTVCKLSRRFTTNLVESKPKSRAE